MVKFIYHYRGYHGCDSKCGVEIIEDRNGQVTVIFTELLCNQGTSITNMIEKLATEIYYKYLSHKPVNDIRWLEHYPKDFFGGETYDEVSLEWDGEKFIRPKWKRIYKI